MTARENDPFDEIMELVGNNGKFQFIYKYVILLGTTICATMIYMNIILALNIPDHWCFIPGKNETNLTISEWRNLTIPSIINNKGENSFSNCLMYNQSYKYLSNNKIEANISTTRCINGYEYDTEYYDESIPMKENWVCDKDFYVTQNYMITRAAEIIGIIFLGHCGDIIGRRYTFFICLVIALGGRVLSIITSHSYTLFAITNTLPGFSALALFQSPFIIGMEISRSKDRAQIKIIQCIGWTLATMIMPFLYWFLRHWLPFMWYTSLPILIMLLFPQYMIESPRWLINKKKFKEALKQLKRIAKINKKKITLTEEKIADMFEDIKKEKTYGFASLLGNFRLAKNTLITSSSSGVIYLSYFTLLLFSSKIGGNPFLNFLIQSVVDLPAYWLGKYLVNKLGRRITHFLALYISAFIFFILTFLVSDASNEMFTISLVAMVQFLNGLGFFVIGLQAIEIFPTCLRQTGSSIESFISNFGGIAAPTLVYLGTNYNIQAPYIILAISNFLVGFAAMFLPETLYCKLPDTLEDAKIFGKDQLFWSYPKSNEKNKKIDSGETEKLDSEKMQDYNL